MALKDQVGDYNLLYQFIICIFTYIPINPVYMYKGLSIVFDFLMAFTAAGFVAKVKNEKIFGICFNVTYFTVIMWPAVAINSALWGQCDSIYTFFLLVSLLYLISGKNIKAFVFYGLALALKFQTIFLLPFLIIYYFYKKEFTILLFSIPVAILWISGIPGYILGRSLLAPFKVYLEQTETFEKMWLNSVSFWQLVGGDYIALSKLAIMVTLALMGLALYAVISGKIKIDNTESFLQAAIWSVWTCVLFLPAMHERYTYPVDILLIILALINKKYIKYAFAEAVVSLWSYGVFLFLNPGPSIYATIAVLALWFMFTTDIVKNGGNVIKNK